MRFIAHVAATLVLAIHACAAAATTVCLYDQRFYFGKNAAQVRIDEYNNYLRKSADEQMARNQNGAFVCWMSPRSPEDHSYCELAFSDHSPFLPGHLPINIMVGLEMGPTETVDISRTRLYGRGKATLYSARTVHEIWEVEVWNPQNATAKYIRKLANTYSPNYAYFTECGTVGSAIAFLNGVFTTSRSANNSLDAIRTAMGSKQSEVDLQYKLLYNQTQCDGETNVSCYADLAETFQQRQDLLDSRVKDRWEIFWDIIAGRHNDPSSITGSMLNRFGSAATNLIADLDSAMRNRMLKKINDIYTLPSRSIDTAEHIETLGELSRNSVAAVVVAHSQGNLFVPTLAKEYPKAAQEYEGSDFPKHVFVHVAPPTDNLLGPYLLADIDLVVNGLKALVPRGIPSSNVAIPLSTGDLTGHGFVETYMDSSRPALGRLTQLISGALAVH